jgi:23S rRNA pseudouridine1911/1915/1917 synthase
MPFVDKRFVIPPGRPPGRADRVVQELTGLSRSGVFGLFDHGCAAVNGEPCRRPGLTVRPGDVVEVRLDPHTRYSPRPPCSTGGAFRVVFEDPHLLVVDKKAGVLTVPTDLHEPDTLVHAIGSYLGGPGRPPRRVEVVHRLDRVVSGLLVFARSPDVARGLVEQFADRKPDREYVAVVAGRLEPDEGVFEGRIATGRDLRRYVTDDPDEGEVAVTRYRVERHLPGATRVRIRLETGRRNQIRVQFAEAGHPVIGDLHYAPELARHPAWRLRRIALHAAVLGFQHPVTGEALRFESRPPRCFDALEGGTTEETENSLRKIDHRTHRRHRNGPGEIDHRTHRRHRKQPEGD